MFAFDALMQAAPSAPIDDGLVAPCTRCGAPQPIRLLGRARPCAYCHARDPLDHAARARVAAAARALSATKNDHQLPDAMVASAGNLGWFTFALVGGCILVSGGIALGWVGSSLPDGIGLVAFLRSGHAQGLDAYGHHRLLVASLQHPHAHHPVLALRHGGAALGLLDCP